MPRVPRPDSDRRSHHKKTPTVILPADGVRVTVPNLPEMGGKWHALTVAWWSDTTTGIWSSPMASELANSDVHGLIRLALLIDDFHHAETPRERAQLSAEIRLLGANYGIDPTARRRLGWRIEAPKDDNAVQRYLKAGHSDGSDPRDILRP